MKDAKLFVADTDDSDFGMYLHLEREAGVVVMCLINHNGTAVATLTEKQCRELANQLTSVWPSSVTDLSA